MEIFINDLVNLNEMFIVLVFLIWFFFLKYFKCKIDVILMNHYWSQLEKKKTLEDFDLFWQYFFQYFW